MVAGVKGVESGVNAAIYRKPAVSCDWLYYIVTGVNRSTFGTHLKSLDCFLW